VCVTLKGSKIKTFDDVLRDKAVFGGVSTNDSTQEYGYLHKRTAGARYDVVSGYRGTPELALALERGEIDGVCGYEWSGMRSNRPEWIRDRKLNVLVQISLEFDAEMAEMGVPPLWDYLKSEQDRKAVELIVSQQMFQRPFVVPPGVPAEQVATLRTAFDATMADRQFRDDAERTRIDIVPLSGVKVQELVERIYAAPKDVIERAKELLRP
jgi:hypothetical protein